MLNKHPINDITTTYPNVPQFKVIAADRSYKSYDYPTKFYSLQKSAYGDLEPLRLDVEAKNAFRLVDSLARKQSGWEIVSVDNSELRLEAVSTTPILRFKDDVVIEVRPTDQGGERASVVHMRSKSRVGRSDLGANAARIRRFLNELRSFR